MISAIDWMPGKYGVLATACSESKSFDERLQSSGKPSNSYVLIWSFSDPIHPQIVLESASDIFSLCFNPTKPGLVAGGCYNGQVILWDISVAEEQIGKRDMEGLKVLEKDKEEEKHRKAPVVVCALLSSAAKSHIAIVSDLHWLSPDFQMIFWDISYRKQANIDLETKDERRAAEIASQKYEWVPVLQIDLSLNSPHWEVGPLKMFLSGDSHFFCCTEKPIFVSRSPEGYLTTGCWSPSRPSVIYIGLIDGSIEVWDLLDHSHQPSVVASIGSCQVTSMEFCSSSPQLLAVGDIQGILHIMEIPRRLRRMQHKEKIIMQKFFERQQAWVKDVEERATERTKEIEKRQAEEAAKKERDEQLSKCCWDENMEAEYQQYELQCRIKFGIGVPLDTLPPQPISKRLSQATQLGSGKPFSRKCSQTPSDHRPSKRSTTEL